MSKHLSTILKLENRIDDLEDELKIADKEYKKLQKKYDELHANQKGNKEMELLRDDNNRLRAELNTLKRTGRQEGNLAKEKLKEIQRILNYNPKGG